MLASHLLWVPLASFLPFSAGINVKRDTAPLDIHTTWLVHAPNPANGSYQYRTSTDGGWVDYPADSNDREFENDNIIGWRLTDDDDSAIIIRVNTTNDNLASGIVWNCTSYCDDVTLLLDTGVDITFPTTTPTLNTNDSAWYNTTDIHPLKTHSTVYAYNSCDGDGIFYNITTIDGKGNKLSYSGWNNLAAPIPKVYPVTAVVFGNSILGGATENIGSANVTFYGIEPWSVAWGEGVNDDRPKPLAGLHARVIWCND